MQQYSELIQQLKQKFGNQVRRCHILQLSEELNVHPGALLRRRDIMCGRGEYDLSKLPIVQPKQPEKELTPEEIEAKIEAKFHALKVMSTAAAESKTRAVIISGPGGLGKTFEVVKAIKSVNPDFDDVRNAVRGMVRPTGVYKALWDHQMPGKTLIFDDADSIFYDDASLNLLKAACDTTEKRVISWRAEHRLEDELGERLPNYFEFHGNVVFITNIDFKEAINRGTRLSPHLEALKTRAHYLDLELKTKREYLLRIHQVMRECLAANKLNLLGIKNPTDCKEILDFMKDEISDLTELSLRKVIQLAQVKEIGENWKSLAKTLG
jgi:hypothetical protein